jgi:hypothetical protein
MVATSLVFRKCMFQLQSALFCTFKIFLINILQRNRSKLFKIENELNRVIGGIKKQNLFQKTILEIHVFPLVSECIFCLLPYMAENLENSLNLNALNITVCQMPNLVNIGDSYIKHLSSY